MSDPRFGMLYRWSENGTEYLRIPRLGHSCSFFYYLGATAQGMGGTKKNLVGQVPSLKKVCRNLVLLSSCSPPCHSRVPWCQGDNLLWAASVGLVRSKEVPEMQRRWGMLKGGATRNDAVR